jgi:hypothetical protein
MSTTGLLTDLSLREIFQFVEKGHKSGLLRLRALPEDQAVPSPTHYIWAHQGRIVAAANRFDQQGLVTLIVQTLGLRQGLVTKLAHLCPSGQPLGLFLKNQFVVESEQLEHLFQVQISQQVCALFKLDRGQFHFTPNTPIPTQEMTGLSVPATLLNRYGLLEFLLWDVDEYSSKREFSLSGCP